MPFDFQYGDQSANGYGSYLGGVAQGNEPFVEDALIRRRQHEQNLYGLYGHVLGQQAIANRFIMQDQFRQNMAQQQNDWKTQRADQNLQNQQQLFDYKYDGKALRQAAQYESGLQWLDQQEANIWAKNPQAQQNPQMLNAGDQQRLADYQMQRNYIQLQKSGLRKMPVLKPQPPDPQKEANENALWTEHMPDGTAQVHSGMPPPGIPYLLRNRNGVYQHVENKLPDDQIQQQKVEVEQRKAEHQLEVEQRKAAQQLEVEHRRAAMDEYHTRLKASMDYRNMLLKATKLVPVETVGADGKKTTSYENQPLHTPEEVDQMVGKAFPSLTPPQFNMPAQPMMGNPALTPGMAPPSPAPMNTMPTEADVLPNPANAPPQGMPPQGQIPPQMAPGQAPPGMPPQAQMPPDASQPPPVAPQSDSVPTVASKAQYDAIPKGAVYVDARDGKRHRKQ